MSDAPVKIDQLGARMAAVTTGTQESIDLTTLGRRWIKVWADQDFYYFMAPGSSVVTYAMDTAAADKALGSLIPFECASGAAGQPVLVDPKYPWLHVKAKTATAQIQIKTTSDAQSDE
jgi:hypothetical protein